MKRLLLFFILLPAIAVFAGTQSRKEPLLGISFGKSGMVLTGTDATNHVGKTYDITQTYSIYNPLKNNYLGSTNNKATGYYYIMYDADDALGKSFAKEVTWEILSVWTTRDHRPY